MSAYGELWEALADALRAVVAEFPDDPENAHIAMDDLLCRALRSAGADEAVDVFEAQKRWYS